MYCRECGTELGEGAELCIGCGCHPLRGDSYCQACGAETELQQKKCTACGEILSKFGAGDYASFWLRFTAYIIDGVVLYFLASIPEFTGSILIYIVMGIMLVLEVQSGIYFFIMGLLAIVFIVVLPLLIVIFYFVIMHSSKWQATFGKKVMRIKVVDPYGNKITFWRALGRSFAMTLSYLSLFVGFIMAGFTLKKQALHDMATGTLVVKEKR